MSSRSIGVTNVWFSRWMMSCVMRSPSCSQIRISRASSLRSGYSASSSSSNPTARWMLPPASSNRSKNWRSPEERTFDRRTRRGRYQSIHLEPGQLHPPRRQLSNPVPHSGHRLLPVVLDPALLHVIVLDNRICGTMVAVPRHSDASGVHQLDATRPGPSKGDVDVPCDHPPRVNAADQLLVPLAGRR